MVTRKVSIWIRYKQESEWAMKRAQWSANRSNLVPGMVKGARIAAAEYLYYLRYQRDGKRIMEPMGRDSEPWTRVGHRRIDSGATRIRLAHRRRLARERFDIRRSRAKRLCPCFASAGL